MLPLGHPERYLLPRAHRPAGGERTPVLSAREWLWRVPVLRFSFCPPRCDVDSKAHAEVAGIVVKVRLPFESTGDDGANEPGCTNRCACCQQVPEEISPNVESFHGL